MVNIPGVMIDFSYIERGLLRGHLGFYYYYYYYYYIIIIVIIIIIIIIIIIWGG